MRLLPSSFRPPATVCVQYATVDALRDLKRTETAETLVLSKGEDKNLLANAMSLQILGGGWTSQLLHW